MQSASGEGKVAPEVLISKFEVEKLLKQGSKAHATLRLTNHNRTGCFNASNVNN